MRHVQRPESGFTRNDPQFTRKRVVPAAHCARVGAASAHRRAVFGGLEASPPKCTAISTPGSDGEPGSKCTTIATSGSQGAEQAGAPTLLSATSAEKEAGRKSLCDSLSEAIRSKIKAGLTAKRIYQDLLEESAFTGSYQSVKRFVAKLPPTVEPQWHALASISAVVRKCLGSFGFRFNPCWPSLRPVQVCPLGR